jgi:hypothetical protein
MPTLTTSLNDSFSNTYKIEVVLDSFKHLSIMAVLHLNDQQCQRFSSELIDNGEILYEKIEEIFKNIQNDNSKIKIEPDDSNIDKLCLRINYDNESLSLLLHKNFKKENVENDYKQLEAKVQILEKRIEEMMITMAKAEERHKNELYNLKKFFQNRSSTKKEQLYDQIDLNLQRLMNNKLNKIPERDRVVIWKEPAVGLTHVEGDFVACGRYDSGKIDIFSINSQIISAIKSFGNGITGMKGLCEVVKSCDGLLLCGSALYNDIKVFDYNRELVINFLKSNSPIRSLIAFGEYALASTKDNAYSLWNIHKQDSDPIRIIPSPNGTILSIEAVPNAKIATGTNAAEITLWSMETGAMETTLCDHTSTVSCLKLASKNTLLSAAYDKTIKLWDIRQNILVHDVGQHDGAVRCLHVINENMFVSGSSDNTIRIWDIRKSLCLSVLKGHLDAVVNIIDVRGKLVSASIDKTVRIWS